MSSLSEDAHKTRPNCGIPESFFKDDMIICTGEDPGELVQAMKAVIPGRRPRIHEYRCYRAWRFKEMTVVISGIGSGSLEPLMYELLDDRVLGDKIPKRIVLIGTAGFVGASGLGQVYLVDGAYPVGSAVSLEDWRLPLRPRFLGLDRLALPRAEEISTDYYYACTVKTDNPEKNRAKFLDSKLSSGLQKYWREGRLISMETAQFYHFASTYGHASTQYVAFRGVANHADKFETQGQYSVQVLTETLRQAVLLLSETA